MKIFDISPTSTVDTFMSPRVGAYVCDGKTLPYTSLARLLYFSINNSVGATSIWIHESIFLLRSYICTFPERKVHNACFCQTQIPLYIKKYKEYKNKRYITEKPYKIATRNEKKSFEFPNICHIFRAFFEKAVFLENGCGRH